ncbi:MAG: sulfur carrier protein ThiS [Flavobacteriales bacterium]|nr:sulfur carrier protein ThiS [Flavobacteriales bacterium]
MKVILNSEEMDTESSNLLDLLSEKSFQNSSGIAVALNKNVIPKSAWKTTAVKQNDSIMIITATQGG